MGWTCLYFDLEKMSNIFSSAVWHKWFNPLSSLLYFWKPTENRYYKRRCQCWHFKSLTFKSVSFSFCSIPFLESLSFPCILFFLFKQSSIFWSKGELIGTFIQASGAPFLKDEVLLQKSFLNKHLSQLLSSSGDIKQSVPLVI